jgi:hypothetical protein
MDQLQNSKSAATCAERHIIPLARRLNNHHERTAALGHDFGNRDGATLGARMEHTSSHHSFNVLFMVSFLASFVVVMLHFG